MKVRTLDLEGVLVVEPSVFPDERGFFLESYQYDRYAEAGIGCTFVQDNHSKSTKGTLRGLHYQTSPGQAKLVRVGRGKVFDVAVDIRPDSPTFGKWAGVTLDDESHHQIFVPVGFAHGFCVLSDTAEVLYKVSTNYNGATEAGFRWDDPDVGIDWPVDNPIISERDAQAESFASLRTRLGR